MAPRPDPGISKAETLHARPPEGDRGALPVRIGRYLVIRRLGRGGMGVVYLAYDPDLDRKVALKVLLEEAGESSGVEAMLREARAMAKLRHPNVVSVFDVGNDRSEAYIAMELVTGGTLREWLAARPRSWQEIIGHYAAAGRGLEAAHQIGIIHRDFKPDNVLVGGDGRVQVSDFGLAKARRHGAASSASAPATTVDQAASTMLADRPRTSKAFTDAGMIVGTPGYMAPEQLDTDGVDERADQFSFCVALYEALYGERPFAGEHFFAMIDAILAGQVRPPPRQTRVPGRIHRILVRGLAPAPEDRYPSMTDLIAALEFDPTRRIRRAALMVVAAVATVAGVAGVSELVRARARATRAAEQAAQAEEAARAQEVRAADADRRARVAALESLHRTRLLLAETLISRTPSVALALLFSVPPDRRDASWRQRALDLSRTHWPLWTIHEHPERVVDLVSMRDGTFAAASDGIIYVHETKTRSSMLLHGARVNGDSPIAVSPDEHQVASAWVGGNVLIWSLDRPEEAPRRLAALPGRPTTVDFSRDGRGLIVGYADHPSTIWDLEAEAPAPVELVEDEFSQTRHAASLADGWITVALSGRISLWNRDGALISRGQSPPQVSAATLDHSRQRLAIGNSDGVVSIWDVAPSLRRHALLTGHRALVRRVQFGTTGQWLVTASNDETVRVWDLHDHVEASVFGDSAVILDAALINDDTEVLISSDPTGLVRHHRDGTGVPSRYIHGDETIQCIFPLDGGAYFVSSSVDRSLAIWPVHERAGFATFRYHARARMMGAVSADGSRVLTDADRRAVAVWDAESGELQGLLSGHADDVWTAVSHPHKPEAATGSDDATVRIWDLEGLRERCVLRGHRRRVYDLAYDAAGEWLASAGDDPLVGLWRPGACEQVALLEGHTAATRSPVFSADGRSLLTMSNDTTLRVWDLATRSSSQILSGHEAGILGGRFSPDSRWVVSASFDKTARIWDLAAETSIVLRHPMTVNWAEFDPSGRLVATACDDGLVRIWDAESGHEQRALSGHTSRVRRVRFDPTGATLLSASWDRSARIWALADGTSIALGDHPAALWYADFVGDDRIATAAMDGSVRLWDARVDAETLVRRLSPSAIRCPDAFSGPTWALIPATWAPIPAGPGH